MEDDDLEQVMIKFFHQEFNLLLCTTIIESGIDIPTANTIIIHNADRFGLAQIYQLRGRVGRGGHRAYAYLLVEEGKRLTPRRRSGWPSSSASRTWARATKWPPTTWRSAAPANLLGTSQSGQMAAIGYELYTELLEKAIHELKGETVLEEIDPSSLRRSGVSL
jgi:transcription-repair coupling factor (superfamily II helicase)